MYTTINDVIILRVSMQISDVIILHVFTQISDVILVCEWKKPESRDQYLVMITLSWVPCTSTQSDYV